MGVLALCVATLGTLPVRGASAPIVLTGADRRPATSLAGQWSYIIGPYFSGLFDFHHQEKKNGWFLNEKVKPGDTRPIEYDFSLAPKLNVPGDWNTQCASLFDYESGVLGGAVR